MNVVGRETEKLRLKIIEAVSCVATASPLLFDFLTAVWYGVVGVSLSSGAESV